MPMKLTGVLRVFLVVAVALFAAARAGGDDQCPSPKSVKKCTGNPCAVLTTRGTHKGKKAMAKASCVPANDNVDCSKFNENPVACTVNRCSSIIYLRDGKHDYHSECVSKVPKSLMHPSSGSSMIDKILDAKEGKSWPA